MANHDNYVIQGNTLDAIASEVKTLADISDKISPNEMSEKLGQVNTDVEIQADIIAQIQTALEGKAAGNGSEIIAEIVSLIDQSGVLDSTEGTVTDKVEQLINNSSMFNMLTGLCFRGNKEIKNIDVYLDRPYVSLQNAFEQCSNLKHIVGINASKSTSNGRIFYQSGIQIIDKPFDFSSQTSATNFSPFDNAHSLVEVRIEPNTYKWTSSIHSPVLSDNSIQSIIDGLAIVTTTQSIRFHAKVVEKLTDEQKATISSKGWTLVQL